MRPFMGGRGYAKPGHHRQPSEGPTVHTGLIHAISFAEQSPHDLLNALKARDDLHGGLYMGAAGFLNLTLMGATKPGSAILFDLNPVQTAVFWPTLLDIVKEESNGRDALKALVDKTHDIHKAANAMHREAGHFRLGHDHQPDVGVERLLQTTYMSSPLNQWQAGKSSPSLRWAFDKGAYQHIRRMATEGAIACLTLDVLDQNGWMQLKGRMDDALPESMPRRAKLLYLSNILAFLGDAYDPVFRNEPGKTPGDARKIVSLLMETPERGVIAESANPKMIWPIYAMS